MFSTPQWRDWWLEDQEWWYKDPRILQAERNSKEFHKQKDETVKTIPACALDKAPRTWSEDIKMLSKDDTVCTYGLSKACNFCMWSVLHDKLQTKGIKVKPLLAHPCFADNLCQKVWEDFHVFFLKEQLKDHHHVLGTCW